MAEQSFNDLKHLAGQISAADLERLAKKDNGNHSRHAAPAQQSILDAPEEDTRQYVQAKQQYAAQRRQAARERLMMQKRSRLDAAHGLRATLELGVLLALLLVVRVYGRVFRFKLWFDRQSPLMRGLAMVAVSMVTLIIVGFVFAGEVTAYLEGEDFGPMLAEALADPYALEARPMPSAASDAETLLPVFIADFNRTGVVFSENNTTSLLNHCLLGIPYPFKSEKRCTRTVGQVSTASARYLSRTEMVDVGITRFAEDDHAGRTTVELLHYARQIGQVGNFSVAGTGPVDYFYSGARSWISFTWARGPWVFSVSASSFTALEQAVAALGY